MDSIDTAEIISQGSPHLDSRSFRRCLGTFATGVSVITTEHEGVKAGVTANSFSSLSLDPALILWSIARTSRSYATFQATSKFAVNILASEQIEVSQIFASAETDKFSKVMWRYGIVGAPILYGAVGVVECLVDRFIEGGDHLLIIGRVENYTHYSGTPLLFVQGQYSVANEHPALKKLSSL